MSFLLSVYDCIHGRPAEGVVVHVEGQAGQTWQEILRGRTDEHGQFTVRNDGPMLGHGVYRVEFDVDHYYATLGIEPMFPRVILALRIDDPAEWHDVSLLVMPNAYAAYRTK